MTTTEQLQRIRAKCVELLAQYPPCESTAGWLATIAAIDMLSITVFETDDVCTDGGAGCQAVENAEKMAKEIIAAWKGIV